MEEVSRKLGLIIGNSEYQDARLARLVKPDADATALAEVLQAPEIAGFDEVTTLVNESAATARRAIARFFAQRKPDDLLLLYFSGHGVRDDQGHLYLAVQDTEHDLLSGTAIPAAFITGEMDRSRSRRQVLILDCCNSGAFAHGTRGTPGASVGTASAFEGTGSGRVVLTATDSLQYAWEEDREIGEVENSVFTHYLVQGLRTGEADVDGDGRITLDELYDYVYGQVVNKTPWQTPGKWSYRQQGELVIAHNPRPVVKPVELPPELAQVLESPFAGVREGALRELDRLLQGSHRGLALAAQEALKLLTEDDSRRVAQAAAQVLAADEIRKAEAERTAHEQAEQERLAREKEEVERLAARKAEEERRARERAEHQRLAQERAEAERLERERQERLARDYAEQKRLAREKEEIERLAALKAEEERIAHEKAEQERLAQEKAEADRIARQKAEQEQLAREAEQAEGERQATEEAKSIAAQKAEMERLTRIPAKVEHRAEGAEWAAQPEPWTARAIALTKIIWRPVLLTAAGWAFGYLFVAVRDQFSVYQIASIAGLIGGLVTGLALRWTAPSIGEKNRYVVFGFAITGAFTSGISDAIGWALTTATDYASVGDLGWTWGNLLGWLIGWAMFGAGAGAILSKFWHVSGQQAFNIGRGWAIAGAIGWVIPQAIAPVIKAFGALPWDTDFVILVTSVTLAMAIAGVVGGGVMFWQLSQNHRAA